MNTMKTKIFSTLFAGACIVALASCDDNSWNNEHLKGFDDDPAITDVQSIEYTLTDADYANIAANTTNKSLAGEENANALKAVGTQHYFTDIITAKDYIPAYLGDSKFPYFVLDNGSAVKVTYKVATNLPEEISAATAALEYEVTEADYQTVWGSEEDFISAFAPSHTAAKNIPSILKTQYPDAQAGQYVIVNYKTSDQEPIFSTVEGETASYTHAKVSAITSGKKYVLVAEGKAATAIEGKAYGYLGVTDVTVEGDGLNLTDATAIEFSFIATDGGYYIIDANGKYLYQSGTYNSFNLSDTPVNGAVWTVEAKADGSMKITNTSVGKTIQYDTQYSSYGSYADERGITPVAYEKITGLSSVLATVEKGSTYDIKGVVTGICAQGYMLSDDSGTILVYYGKSYDVASHKIGDVVEINGTIGSYNKGLQVTGSSAVETITGSYDYSYPAAKVYTGAAMDAELSARTEDGLAIYASITGTASVNGNYVNIIVEGATAQGSPYQMTADQKALFVDGEKVTVTGWYIAISGGKYISMVVTNVSSATSKSRSMNSRAVAADVPSIKENAVYYFDGSSWNVPNNFTILNPADYTAMGQSYGNLSTSAKPEVYLPLYLKNKFPYAQAETAKFVLYKYYDGSATYYRCDQYVFNGSEWTVNNGIVEESAQFVKTGGKWMYDPNVTITLPGGKGQEISTLYYQACVNWVFENIDKPLGSTDIKSGKFYVTSYGNNEYYSGTSAYQGNVDLRPSAAKTQYPTEYEGMSDEEIVAKMKERFAREVMPGALASLHADAAPIDGLQVIYTINFAIYTGSTSQHTIRYEVVAPGQFEFIDCTWDESTTE